MEASIRNLLILFWLLFLQFSSANAQKPDSSVKHSNKKTLLNKFAVPTAVIGFGIYGTSDNSFINHDEIKEERDKYFPGFSNKADNYLQFAPIAVVYAMDALGLKGKNNWKQQTKLLGSAQLMMMAFLCQH